MPEGPEVETIRRGLAQGVVGQQVRTVMALWEKSFPRIGTMTDQLIGSTIIDVSRRAKVLIIHLDNEHSLLFHLKMTGQIVFVKADGERYAGGHPTQSMAATLPDASTRVIFTFVSGDRVFFNDQRKFGWIKIVPTADVELDPLIARLGPEVDSDDFSIATLSVQLARHRRAPIKPVLLDQGVVAGLGNIYVDESLHLARIHPSRLAGSLTPNEIGQLHRAIKEIMAAGIEHGGTSFAHYVNSLGGKGDYLEQARVFRRQGEACRECGNIIAKLRVGGRGTHICPSCQILELPS